MKKIVAIFLFFISIFLQSIMAQGEQQQFPFPNIPDLLVEPQQRAEWLFAHYWDNVDFSDKNIISDTIFIEQAFVNFLSILPILQQPSAIEIGVETLMHRAEVNSKVYRNITYLAEKYLFEPNSPMASDEHYIYFLQQINASQALSPVEKSRTQYQYQVLSKNRIGMQAPDFAFVTAQGVTSTLHSINIPELILVFYDPECDHCAEVVNKMASDVELNRRIVLGSTKVLAVYPDGDRSLWTQSNNQMPSHWIVAFATSPLQSVGKYIFRSMPTIYTLDKNKIIIAKE